MNRFSADVQHSGAFAALGDSQRLLAAFSHASAIGLAILDKQLRYQAVNDALAGMNGRPVEEHPGKTIRDILGDAAAEVERSYQRLFATGQLFLHHELTAILPTRTEPGYWIRNYFPIKDAAARVEQVGVLVIEVTAVKKLAECFSKFTACFVGKSSRQEYVSHARELQDSVQEYQAALLTTLDHLTQQWRDLETSADEQLAPSIELLDRRIVAMGMLVSLVASRFP